MENRPWIAPRYLSLFSAGRPPLPWDLADCLNQKLEQYEIQSIGVTGSICPSVLVACGYGAPDRAIRVGACYSQWDDGNHWGNVIDDSPGMENTYPMPNLYLPVEVCFVEGLSQFIDSDALFIDLPLSHRNVGAEWFPSLQALDFKLIVMGFLQNHEGPNDVLEVIKTRPFTFEEYSGSGNYSERDEKLNYRLVIAKRTPESE